MAHNNVQRVWLHQRTLSNTLLAHSLANSIVPQQWRWLFRTLEKVPACNIVLLYSERYSERQSERERTFQSVRRGTLQFCINTLYIYIYIWMGVCVCNFRKQYLLWRECLRLLDIWAKHHFSGEENELCQQKHSYSRVITTRLLAAGRHTLCARDELRRQRRRRRYYTLRATVRGWNCTYTYVYKALRYDRQCSVWHRACQRRFQIKINSPGVPRTLPRARSFDDSKTDGEICVRMHYTYTFMSAAILIIVSAERNVHLYTYAHMYNLYVNTMSCIHKRARE